MQPTHAVPNELTERLMLAAKRFELPRWEIRLGANVIGHVQQSQRRSVTFFEAVALHPITGEEVSLELSTDREERLA